MIAVASAGTLAWRKLGSRVAARIVLSAAMTVVPMLMIYGGGRAWEIDWHLYFFVVYAMLVAYVDLRPIVVSAALTVAYHVLLPQAGDAAHGMSRTVLHAAIIAVDCCVLSWIIAQMRALFLTSAEALASAESALSRLRLVESLVVHANDAALIIEADRKVEGGPPIAYVNAAFTRITGYQSKEVVGRSMSMLYGPKTDPAFIDGGRRNLAAGKSILVELVVYRKDRAEVTVEISVVPVEDDDRSIRYWVALGREVTERKAAEEALFRAKAAEESRAALVREVDERRRIEKQLLHAAFHDQLTGLPNRALFVDRLTHAVGRTRRRGNFHAAVLFLDCDRFKIINDSLGHMVGDLLLIGLARRLETCLRPGDTLARLGGDEFTVLLEDVGEESEADRIAERILNEFNTPFSLAGHEVYVTASIGIAHTALGYTSAQDLMRDADIAMYRAKVLGKHRYERFAPELRDRSTRLLQVETELRRALDRGEIGIAYQPIVSLVDGRVLSFEALARWSSAQLGPVSPQEFIPIAEETGMIVALGEQILRESCAAVRDWQLGDVHNADVGVSVNVSGRQVLEPRFVERVSEALASSGLAPQCLQLEFTESILMTEAARVTSIVDELRALGVGIHIDDFGTGYSSLAYLHNFDVDTLKIDRSFVSSGGGGLANPEISQTVIALARHLNLEVTAEGVETREQEEQLRALGCTSAQGFHFARPLDPAQARAFLTARPAAANPSTR